MQPLFCGGAVAFEPQAESDRRPYLPTLLNRTVIMPNDEIRALWVVRDALTSEQAIDRCIDLAVRTRFQLLFVQVRGRGETYYDSSIEPAASDLERPVHEFDPLAHLLRRARAAGIAVHAWLNVFYVWSSGDAAPPAGHVAREHPDWLITDAGGVRMDERNPAEWQASGVEGYFLDPFSPAARAHTAAVVRELTARYPLDGIHLDYVRFPGRGFGFGKEARTGFELIWGVDPRRLERGYPELSGLLGPDAVTTLDSVHVEWRAAHVDSMVMAIREAAGDLPLSAAVVPDPNEAKTAKGQDWIKWVHRRWVDFVVPMAYNHRPEGLLDWVHVLHNAVGRDRLLVGLAVYGGRDRFLARSVNLLRLDRSMGFAVFSYNSLLEKRFPVKFLEEAVFPDIEEQEGQEEQEP